MRRIGLLLTVVLIWAAATLALAGTSFAQGVGSCFSETEKTDRGAPGPGSAVSDTATTLAKEQLTDEAANGVGIAQRARPCPPAPPPST